MLGKRLAIPRDESPQDDDIEPEPSPQALLSALRGSATPAMASDARGRVVFWNRAAERTFARSAASTLGRRCHELIQARDVFGNRFCTENCPVVDMARRNETIRPFEWQVAGPPRERPRKAQVQIVRVPGNGPGQYSLVHLLEPIDEDMRLSRMLSALQVGPGNGNGNGNGKGGPSCARPSEPAQAAPSTPPLTRREREVLDCIARGQQNKEIAAQLGISLATVRNHVHAILEKLEVHSKLEALSLAVRQGWTQAAGPAD
jgi:DNA-binding CsgD family transcriptional regulator